MRLCNSRRKRSRRTADASREKFEKALREIVEIPTVSVEPERKADVARGARYAAVCSSPSGGKARVYETGGHPSCTGGSTRSCLPTATIYNHLDVQPAEGEDWKTRTVQASPAQGDAYFGRGTTDDKGPAISRALRRRVRASTTARASTSISSGSSRRRSARHTSRTRSGRTPPTSRRIPSSSPTRSGCRAGIPPARGTARARRASLHARAPAQTDQHSGHDGRRGAQSRHRDLPS